MPIYPGLVCEVFATKEDCDPILDNRLHSNISIVTAYSENVLDLKKSCGWIWRYKGVWPRLIARPENCNKSLPKVV